MIERSRLVIWLLVIIILLSVYIASFLHVENKAGDTAFLVASQRIVERASYYRQQWLLAREPSSLNIDGEVIKYSTNGWVLPINDEGSVDCEKWYQILYPDSRVLERYPISISDDSDSNAYRCEYHYTPEKWIVIGLIDGRFSANISFLAN